MNAAPLIVEQTYNAPIAKVWQAITDEAQMRQWYFNIPGFKPEVGFTGDFYGDEKNKKYLTTVKVVAVDPPNKLSISWDLYDSPGETFIDWELFDEGGKTRLKLTHTGLEKLKATGTDFTRESFEKGWGYFVNTALPKFVEAQ